MCNRLYYLTCYSNQLTSLNVVRVGWLVCSDNQLTSLDVSKCGSMILLRCSSNLLTTTALNSFFNSLPYSSIGSTVNITNNPGTNTCDKTIATAKGWTVYDY